MSKPDDGPAFPHEDANKFYPGMMLRDYFAARVMQAITGSPDVPLGKEGLVDAEAIAKTSYRIADAMLKERLE